MPREEGGGHGMRMMLRLMPLYGSLPLASTKRVDD